MTHKVVMSNLHLTADDNFIRHDERHDLRVFFQRKSLQEQRRFQCTRTSAEPSVSRITWSSGPACGAQAACKLYASLRSIFFDERYG